MPRCSMFVTQPNAIIGQLSIVRYAVERDELAEGDAPDDHLAAAQPQDEQRAEAEEERHARKEESLERDQPRLRRRYSSLARAEPLELAPAPAGRRARRARPTSASCATALMSESCAWICSNRLWIALPKYFTEIDTNGSGISDSSVSRASIDTITRDRHDEHQDRVRRVHDRRADHHADGVQVVGRARHQVAGPVRLEVRERQPLQMREEVVAHVVLDVARGADQDAARQKQKHAADEADGEQEDAVPEQLGARDRRAAGRRSRS